MKSILQTKFWKLPVILKLVVIWFFLQALSSFWKTGSLCIETRCTVDIGSLISGIICWGLAIGLINKNNVSRKWAVIVTSLGSLFGLFLLALAIFGEPNSPVGLQLQTSMSQIQTIIFLVVYLVLNAGTLFILLRLETKTLFTPQTTS